MSAERARLWVAALGGCVLAAAALAPATADVRRVQDTFTATTAGMTPAGLALRFQVLEWSADAARADVVATLDDTKALAKLPTVGYVWPAGSPVGYAVKYAHRTQTDDGRDRITFVTDKALGSYEFKKWNVAGVAAPAPSAGYSVIELYVDSAGNGVGTFSLAAEVVVDEATSTVSLAPGGANLLADVKRQPGT
jgi:hypothetical protein